MNKRKKLMAIVLCTLMTSSVLTACKSSNKQEGDTGSVKKIDYSAANEYSWWMYATPNDYYTSYSDNPVVKYFDKKFNTTLKFQQPAAGTESNALNTMLATGDYTDLIDSTYYTGAVNQLYSDGVIIDLAKYLNYMPNLKKLIDEDKTLKKNIYNDDGKIFKLPLTTNNTELSWGGLVYREDILKTMTGGNIKFPSGGSEPTTVEDWDYMLPLYIQYFQAAKMKEYAPLIIPSTGYFTTNELISGFGVGSSYYLDGGKVKYGPMEDGYYNYLAKMKEWYQKGYIYKDFASRTNDLFYLPNTSLTYGGAAGIWFGIGGQLGTKLSMPQYNLNVNVKALASPLDQVHGVTSAPINQAATKGTFNGGVMISSKCKDIERLLSSLDYFYSKEGSYLLTYGLDEKNAANDDLYKKYKVEGWKTDSSGNVLPQSAVKGTVANGLKTMEPFLGIRLVGVRNEDFEASPQDEAKVNKDASAIWQKYDNDTKRSKLPTQLLRTTDEDAKYTKNESAVDDYVNSMVLKFILGSTDLNQTTWQQFKDQLVKDGVKDNIAIVQTECDRYNKR